MSVLRRSHAPSALNIRHRRSPKLPGVRLAVHLVSHSDSDDSDESQQSSPASPAHHIKLAAHDAASTSTNLTSTTPVPALAAAGSLSSATNLTAVQQDQAAGAMSLTARIGIIGGASVLGLTFAAFIVWMTYSLVKARKNKSNLGSMVVTPFQPCSSISRPGMVVSESYGPDSTLVRKMSYRSDDWQSYSTRLVPPEPISSPEWRNSKIIARQDSVVRQYQTSSSASSMESLDDNVLEYTGSGRSGPVLKPLVLPQKVYGERDRSGENDVLVSQRTPLPNGAGLQSKLSTSSLRSNYIRAGSNPFAGGSDAGESYISSPTSAQQWSINKSQSPTNQTSNIYYPTSDSASNLSLKSSVIGRSGTPSRSMARGGSLSRSVPFPSANTARAFTASPEQIDDFPLPPISQPNRLQPRMPQQQQQQRGPVYTGTMTSQSPISVNSGTEQTASSNQTASPYQPPHQPPPLAQVRQQRQQVQRQFQQEKVQEQQRQQQQQQQQQQSQQQEQEEQERLKRQQWQQPQPVIRPTGVNKTSP